jgi:FkbM family methyltransferase
MFSFSGLIRITITIFSFLSSRWRGVYTFSINDLFLYLKERYYIQHPSINVISHQGDDLILLEIGGRRIFWPSSISNIDLSWLFGEVFAQWSVNPSSYNHPALEISNAKWIVDGGACEGFFSLFALEQGAQRVVAVEPLGLLWPALRNTFAEYSDARRFALFEGALGKAIGMAHLKLDPQHACDATVVPTDTGQQVTLITLDELGEHYNLEAGGIIKLDIEGAEMDALRGATRLLQEYKPKLAVSVYHGFDNAKLCAKIIQTANPSYTIEFRGMYGWFSPPRPYMLIAW